MARFTDSNGDDWLVVITVFHADRCKADVDVNLNDALVGVRAGGEVTEENLITRLDADPGLLVSVLYSLCRDQVDERGLSPDDFARRFAGDVINSAFAALVEALLAFFPKPNQRAALEAQLRLMADAQRRLLERWKTAQATVDAMAATAIDRQVDAELEKLRVRFGQATSTGSSTAPPAS